MDKINIEITKHGWEIQLDVNNKVLIETHAKTLLGATTLENELNFSNISPELFEAISEINMKCYDIMKNLQ